MNIVTIALIVAAIFAVAGFIVELFNDEKKPFGVAITSGVVVFLVELLFLYSFMPSFAHWLSAGYVGSIFIGLIILLIVQAIFHGEDMFGYNEDFSYILPSGTLLLLIGLFLAIAAFFTPPLPIVAFDNETYDELAGLLNIRDAYPEEYALMATDDDLIKIHPGQALSEAGGVIPDAVDSFTAVDTAYEQTVDGRQVYITDLQVDNWPGYREGGASIPGFIMREAKDVNAQSIFREGYDLRYVPSARWNLDLYRHVYLNFVLGTKYQVEHLDVLELDDEGVAWYTGTVWEYVIGKTGMQVVGVITVNPTTGDITFYNNEEIPEWIDRVYSMDKAKELVSWWAKYYLWDAKIGPETTKDKFKVDGAEDVYGHDGRLYFMFTITTVANNETLRYEVRFDPRTGEAVKFEAEGKTLEAVKKLITERTFIAINPDVGAQVVECERQQLLGVSTWYCILEQRSGESDTTASSGENGSTGIIVGYAFLQSRYSSVPDKVIIGQTFNEAWRAFRQQVTQGDTGDENVQGLEAETITMVGNITQKGDTAVDGFIPFVVVNEQYPMGVVFQISETSTVISLSKPGHEVEVVAYDLYVDDINDVVEIWNKDLPGSLKP